MYNQPYYQAPPPPQPRRKRRWPWILGGILVLLIIVGSCNAGGQDNSATPVSGGAADPGLTEPTSGPAGATLVSDGVAVTASNLDSQAQFGQSSLCSMVKYVNNSDQEVSFNGGFDWKLQDPAGVIHNPSIMGDDLLSAGQLAPGGKVAGNVCFDTKGSGEYTLTMEPFISFSGDKLSWMMAR